MCGISGIVNAGSSRHRIDSQTLAAMMAAQRHRGPDSQGCYSSPSGQCALGFNRLKILDLGASGDQPMSDVSGRYHIVFNGEIYNYLELKQSIGPYPYRGTGDTEVLLASYLKWGPACVDRFVGMFAFAVWDERDRTLFCARDRLGVKPFHYVERDGTFYFSSEIKALLAAGIAARPDAATWSTYLQHGIYDHGDATFFEGIRKLPAGHTLTWKDGMMAISRYWDLPARAAERLELEPDEAAEQYRAMLEDSVRLRLRSDVPVGLNLSDGLDSAALMALIDRQAQGSGDLIAFTLAFLDPVYDETDYAEQVPRAHHWKRHWARMDAEALWSAIDTLTWHQEAPYGGIGTLAYYTLVGVAKEHGVTVLIDGEGADECLGGYAYYQTAQSDRLYQDGTSFLRSDCLRPAALTAAPSFPAPFSCALSNRLYRDLSFTKMPRVLRINDRSSMAWSKEVRQPYIDHRLVEFCFRLPSSLKIRDGQSKFLLRHALRGVLPEPVRCAPKRAVVTPQVPWTRTLFRRRILALVRSRRFRDYGVFDPAACETALDEFCRRGDNAFFVWQWINFDSWHRSFGITP